jgi:hypothetical protein
LVSPKALAIATLSRIAMSGMMMIAEPSWLIIPLKSVSSSVLVSLEPKMPKGGAWKDGSPDSICPVRVKTQFSGSSLQLIPSGSIIAARTRHRMTIIAFLPVQMNQMTLLRILRAVGGILFQKA